MFVGGNNKVDARKNVIYILNFVFQTRSTKVTFRARCRGLRLLSMIACDDLVDKIYGEKVKMGAPRLELYHDYCKYMCSLEKIKFAITIDQLISCDKHGLARSLWRDYQQKPAALRLIASLIVRFTINDIKLFLRCASSTVETASYAGRYFATQ